MYTLEVITKILEGLGVKDLKEQDNILDVVKASSTISLELLKPKEFTELVTDTLTHLRERQEAKLKKANEEKARKSWEIADALYLQRQEEATRKEKEEAEREILEIIRQETHERLAKRKKNNLKIMSFKNMDSP